MSNVSMNELILQSARRRERTGLIDRLRGAAPLGDDRQERLNYLLSEHESAARRGDAVAAEMADVQIGKLLDAARAAKAPEPAAPAPTPQFDGGVRRPVQRPRPVSMNTVIRQARAERRAAEAAAGEWA
jgi:hypothetical protein